MAERSKALRSGRSLVLQAWVRIPLLTIYFLHLGRPACDDVTMLMFQLECERAERMRLEHAVKTGSLPDDCKMGVATLGAELAAAKLSYSAGACAILFAHVSVIS